MAFHNEGIAVAGRECRPRRGSSPSRSHMPGCLYLPALISIFAWSGCAVSVAQQTNAMVSVSANSDAAQVDIQAHHEIQASSSLPTLSLADAEDRAVQEASETCCGCSSGHSLNPTRRREQVALLSAALFQLDGGPIEWRHVCGGQER